MPRKILDVPITEDGRDKGKLFRINEADALTTWKWGYRAVLAMIKNGAEIPDEIAKMGIIGFIAVGPHMLRGVDWRDLEPLLDELLPLLEIFPVPTDKSVVRKLIPHVDIEEPSTYQLLVAEILRLHVGFSSPSAP